MITINLSPEGENIFYIIVNHPTGVKYTNQSGGLSCNHPEAEGYIIPIDGPNEISHFDDCGNHSILCWGGMTSHDEELDAHRVDEIIPNLNKALKSIKGFIAFQIDVDRLNELQEAWWPVKGKTIQNHSVIEFTGYIAKSNCD